MEVFTLNVTAEPEHWEALKKVAEHLAEAFKFQSERVDRVAKGESPRLPVVPSSYTEAEKAAYYAGQKNAFETAYYLMVICQNSWKEQTIEDEEEYYNSEFQADIDDGMTKQEARKMCEMETDMKHVMIKVYERNFGKY